MILAHAHVLTGMMPGPTLTNDDVACDDFLSTENLDAKALAMRFASVLGTTDAFLVCHFLDKLKDDYAEIFSI